MLLLSFQKKLTRDEFTQESNDHQLLVMYNWIYFYINKNPADVNILRIHLGEVLSDDIKCAISKTVLALTLKKSQNKYNIVYLYACIIVICIFICIAMIVLTEEGAFPRNVFQKVF